MTVREEKVRIVNEIAEKLKGSVCTVLTDYRGLTVAEDSELRKRLREAGVEFKVVKNTLTRRATVQTELTELDTHLIGPTAIAFSTEDLIAPAKIIVDFAKQHTELSIKAGVVDGKVVTVDEIKTLASLPSREGLLSMLLSVLQAPVRNLALAVKAVADQKDTQEA